MLIPVPLVMAFVAEHHISVGGLLRLWRALRVVSLLLHDVGGEGAGRKRLWKVVGVRVKRSVVERWTAGGLLPTLAQCALSQQTGSVMRREQ